MDEREDGSKQIIDGILEDARDEAEKVTREAESRVEDRRKLLNSRLQRIEDDAHKEAQRRADEINRQTEAELSRLERQNNLVLRRDVLAIVHERVVECLSALSRGETREGCRLERDYAEVLTGWIAEGVMGLDGTHFHVSGASADELSAVKAVLAEAARVVADRFGDEVTLEVASEPHGGSAGVVVTSADGRTLYDNRVDSRMRRHGSEVRGIVYDTLFSDSAFSDTVDGADDAADDNGAES